MTLSPWVIPKTWSTAERMDPPGIEAIEGHGGIDAVRTAHEFEEGGAGPGDVMLELLCSGETLTERIQSLPHQEELSFKLLDVVVVHGASRVQRVAGHHDIPERARTKGV